MEVRVINRVSAVEYRPPKQGFSHVSFKASEPDESNDTNITTVCDHSDRETSSTV